MLSADAALAVALLMSELIPLAMELAADVIEEAREDSEDSAPEVVALPVLVAEPEPVAVAEPEQPAAVG